MQVVGKDSSLLVIRLNGKPLDALSPEEQMRFLSGLSAVDRPALGQRHEVLRRGKSLFCILTTAQSGRDARQELLRVESDHGLARLLVREPSDTTTSYQWFEGVLPAQPASPMLQAAE